MSWQCFMVESGNPVAQQQVGAMWFANADYPYFSDDLSANYERDWRGKRDPICVRMPDRSVFCVDACYTGGTNGWTVTGEAPNITVQPSINIVGYYHGWLQNGVISDDCEGRTYES